MSTSTRRLLFVVLLISAHASRTAAQSRDAEAARLDAGIGLTLNQPADVNTRPRCTAFELPCNSPKTMPDFGWSVQAVVRATAHVALVAEAGLYANRWDTTGSPRDQTNHVSALLIGPRIETVVRFRAARGQEGWFRPFVQLLIGPERSTVVRTRTALQPALGVDFPVSSGRRTFRVEFDYRSTHGAGRNLSAHRVLCALALPFGGQRR